MSRGAGRQTGGREVTSGGHMVCVAASSFRLLSPAICSLYGEVSRVRSRFGSGGLMRDLPAGRGGFWLVGRLI